MNNNKTSKGPVQIILYLLAIIGIILIIYRFIKGLGPVSNMSDANPWGIWIGVDIMTGVALSAGGFTLAALVYIFGLKKYHSVVRPAILTAFLGYIFVIIGLLVDIGRSIEIWHAIIHWNNSSAMFEVAWCVMLYTTVLAFEFAPVVFEKYNFTGLQKLYDFFAPWFSIILVSFFVYIMTGTFIYVAIIFVLLAIIFFIFKATLPKGSTIILLIMAGVIYSFAHQSSLGTLFLLFPNKLVALWYTPLIPVNFLLTAIAVGFAMVIFESTLSAKKFGFGLESKVIQGLGKILPWVLLVAIIVKFISPGFSFEGASVSQIFAFGLEVIIGLVLPLILLFLPSIKNNAKLIFYPALFVIIGVVINRINVSIVGMNNAENYYPHIFEILITIGIISIGVLIFSKICRTFPVFVSHES